MSTSDKNIKFWAKIGGYLYFLFVLSLFILVYFDIKTLHKVQTTDIKIIYTILFALPFVTGTITTIVIILVAKKYSLNTLKWLSFLGVLGGLISTTVNIFKIWYDSIHQIGEISEIKSVLVSIIAMFLAFAFAKLYPLFGNMILRIRNAILLFATSDILLNLQRVFNVQNYFLKDFVDFYIVIGVFAAIVGFILYGTFLLNLSRMEELPKF